MSKPSNEGTETRPIGNRIFPMTSTETSLPSDAAGRPLVGDGAPTRELADPTTGAPLFSIA